jgi:nucleotide-binding universal stress UspA family protein
MAFLDGLRMFVIVFKRIVVGYAGDQAGRDAVVLAAKLASLWDAKLTVAFPYHPLFAAMSGDVAEEQVRDELHALLGDHPALATARYHWSTGSWPIRALHELAAYEDADLIAFGAAHGRLQQRHVGLMERMVHGAPCAVAVAPDGYAEQQHGELLRVGVGFADTAEGRAALALGRELAERSGESARVVAGSGLSATLAGYASLAVSLPAIEDEMCEEMKSAVGRVARELDAGHDLRQDVRRGDPSRVLVDASRELDVLILGSRAYGPLRCALLGTVSAEVMRAAHCPVLVLPRKAGDVNASDPSTTALARAER